VSLARWQQALSAARWELAELLPGTALCPAPSLQTPGSLGAACRGFHPYLTSQRTALVLNAIRKGRLAPLANVV